ncbi:alpha/beta hydrolase [Actinoplanes missouriensis]|uniref:alpha/beta hydrolase n=1 Tax=Actinoplanes missouriensis TaxID=1866 RepID=UPI0033F9CEB3
MTDASNAAPKYPAPSTVSEQAKQWLAIQLPAGVYPPREDTAAWSALVEQTNSYLLSHYVAASADLPVTLEDRTIGDVPVYVATPTAPHEQSRQQSGVVYFDVHGGALLFGGGQVCRAGTAMSAASIGVQVWGVDYRIPPLHPYPAGLNDTVAAYRALLEVHHPSRIVVAGSSAGGNLAAALMLRAKNEGLPLPAALILNTPEIDLTESGDTFQTLKEVDNVLSSLKEVNEMYADGADLTDPYLSPIFGDLSGFPPTFLQSGTRDLFLSNTVRMHRKLLAAGVEAELHVFEAMPHGGFGAASPESQELIAAQRAFIAKHLDALS